MAIRKLILVVHYKPLALSSEIQNSHGVDHTVTLMFIKEKVMILQIFV